MKNNKLFLTSISLSIGIFIGIAIMALYSFSSGKDFTSREGIAPISTSQANTYFKNYMATAENYNNVIKGFMVERTQLDAMNMLSNENKELSGFRIYNGKDGNTKLSMIVGVDAQGKDAVSSNIYNMESPNSQPCPTICDLTSPIIGDK